MERLETDPEIIDSSHSVRLLPVRRSKQKQKSSSFDDESNNKVYEKSDSDKSLQTNAKSDSDRSSLQTNDNEITRSLPSESPSMAESTNVISDDIMPGDEEKMNADPYVTRRILSLDPQLSQSSSYATSTSSSRDDQLSIEESPELGEALLQAIVFIEDATLYRSIHHKVDKTTLIWYRIYFSKPVRWSITMAVILLHILAFFEYPSSLSWTADIRTREPSYSLPCGAVMSIEMLCLLMLIMDVIVKIYLIGRLEILKNKWVVICVAILSVSFIDWSVSIALGCSETVRVRRLLRPFFILQSSSLMKKTFNCLRRTLPEVASVLMLLALHLYIFTLLGMLLFPKPKESKGNNITTTFLDNNANFESYDEFKNESDITPGNPSKEELEYFHTLFDSMLSLLVLLTTANNPDVTMPAYQQNRLYQLYFLLYLMIGLYCFMNMLTAVIYNQFRGYFLNSMQASLFRKRLGIRAAFEVLRQKRTSFRYRSSINTLSSGVTVVDLRFVIEHCQLNSVIKKAMIQELDTRQGCILSSVQFQEVLDLSDKNHITHQVPEIHWVVNPYLRVIQVMFAHSFFTYLGILVAFLNVILISVELATKFDLSLSSQNSTLGLINLVFILYYLFEQTLKMWAVGWRRYVFFKGNIFDGFVVISLVVVEIFYLGKYGSPIAHHKDIDPEGFIPLWNVVRIINILIMVRLLRIIPHIKAMRVVASTLLDLIRNLRSFCGILVALYYVFAILGIQLFHGTITYDAKNSSNQTYECGTYKQLGYWANNFDDFAAAIVVLWDVMIVNNWHVFLYEFALATNKWSHLYFICWWLCSVIIVLNLFTAIILENFIMKWDRSQSQPVLRRGMSFEESSHLLSVHEMFRDQLREPEEQELLVELRQHNYLKIFR